MDVKNHTARIPTAHEYVEPIAGETHTKYNSET
jgi:hypothetical protein